MRNRRLTFGTAALATLAGAAVTFPWQGIMYLRNSVWPKLSLASAHRWLDGRIVGAPAARLPEAYRFMDAVSLSLALQQPVSCRAPDARREEH
jgi:hypothetical protein